MRYLYLDNYRGFKSSFIPINSVNFLVGENSTGKTSVLGLLKLLTPQNLWVNNDLDFKDAGLNTFKDIVSIGADDKSYFSIGVVFDSPKSARRSKGAKIRAPLKESDLNVVYMNFTELDGMPKLSSFVSYKHGVEVRIRHVGSNVKYKSSLVDYGNSADKFILTRCKKLFREYRSDNTGYKILKDLRNIYTNTPILFIVAHLEEKLLSKNSEYIDELFDLKTFIDDMAWLAPIRSKPRKTYDEYSLDFSPEGDHTPYLIKKKLDSKTDSLRLKDFFQKIGKMSGLFKSVLIKNYGRGKTAPFELDVVLSQEPLSVSSVGYGVSQALPVIMEIFSRRKGTWFAIQQPEVHLHPRAQAALGEMIYELAESEDKKFVIETHSDYTIDRYRISCRKSKKSIESQILFFERTNSGNKVTCIPIDENGNLSENQPLAYREFYLKEEMDLLGI